MTDHHLARARRMFGDNATVQRAPASKFGPDSGNLAGKCSTCWRKGCRRKWSITIGVLEMGGLMLCVKGQGHTWKDAWSKAERE